MWDRIRSGWLVFMVLVELAAPATVFAQESKGGAGGEDLNRVVTEVSAAIYSKYVWRGINVTDDWVFQPSADVAVQDFTFSGWGNLDLTDENGRKNDFIEIDLTADYKIALEAIELHFGGIMYLFPDAGGDTIEIYGSATMDVLLSPTLAVYRDIDEAKGWYVSFELRHELGGLFSVTEKAGLGPELWGRVAWADDSYNRAYYRHGDSGFADLTVGFDVPWQVGDTFRVFAGAYFSMLLDSTARDRSNKEDNFWIGVGASIAF